VDVSRPLPSQSLKQSRIVGGASGPPYREALLMRTLLNHPWLVDEHAEEIAGLVFSSPALSRLRDVVLTLKGNDISLDSRLLRSQLEGLDVHRVVDLVERAITHKSDKFAEPDTDRAEVEVGWRHTLALHERQVSLQRALEAAERAFQDEGSEEALARIREIQHLIASSVPVEASADG
jgi:DNA primase